MKNPAGTRAVASVCGAASQAAVQKEVATRIVSPYNEVSEFQEDHQ